MVIKFYKCSNNVRFSEYVAAMAKIRTAYKLRIDRPEESYFKY